MKSAPGTELPPQQTRTRPAGCALRTPANWGEIAGAGPRAGLGLGFVYGGLCAFLWAAQEREQAEAE